MSNPMFPWGNMALAECDTEVAELIEKEKNRQWRGLELIASEVRVFAPARSEMRPVRVSHASAAKSARPHMRAAAGAVGGAYGHVRTHRPGLQPSTCLPSWRAGGRTCLRLTPPPGNPDALLRALGLRALGLRGRDG